MYREWHESVTDFEDVRQVVLKFGMEQGLLLEKRKYKQLTVEFW